MHWGDFAAGILTGVVGMILAGCALVHYAIRYTNSPNFMRGKL